MFMYAMHVHVYYNIFMFSIQCLYTAVTQQMNNVALGCLLSQWIVGEMNFDSFPVTTFTCDYIVVFVELHNIAD